jgi:superfamily II DNA helicase RecQ
MLFELLQYQADKLASYLRIHNILAESYHAGKTFIERQHLQQKFMSGKVRILVATIAFGMGINKPDIRSVIHYSVPKSLENYVQEIGRAGRDGELANCHLFLAQQDYLKNRLFACGDGGTKESVRTLIGMCLKEDQEKETRYLILNIGKVERELDMKQSVLNTSIAYLEMEAAGAIRRLPGFYTLFSMRLLGRSV